MLRQHQRLAIGKVVERCQDRAKRRGLIWHTQGSSKTFTLLTAARLILEDKQRFENATVLLVVDRIDPVRSRLEEVRPGQAPPPPTVAGWFGRATKGGSNDRTRLQETRPTQGRPVSGSRRNRTSRWSASVSLPMSFTETGTTRSGPRRPAKVSHLSRDKA